MSILVYRFPLASASPRPEAASGEWAQGWGEDAGGASRGRASASPLASGIRAPHACGEVAVSGASCSAKGGGWGGGGSRVEEPSASPLPEATSGKRTFGVMDCNSQEVSECGDQADSDRQGRGNMRRVVRGGSEHDDPELDPPAYMGGGEHAYIRQSLDFFRQFLGCGRGWWCMCMMETIAQTSLARLIL